MSSPVAAKSPWLLPRRTVDIHRLSIFLSAQCGWEGHDPESEKSEPRQRNFIGGEITTRSHQPPRRQFNGN